MHQIGNGMGIEAFAFSYIVLSAKLMHKVIANTHSLELNGVVLLFREPLQKSRTEPTCLMVLFKADPMAVPISYTLL